MIKVLGIPTILGCNKKGCETAPDYLRQGNLIQALMSSGDKVQDLGDILISNILSEEPSNAKNLKEIKNVVEKTFLSLTQGINPKDKILSIGGDHSMAMGTIFASREKNPNLGIIWIDAHGDCNSPEKSPTGNVHGMPLSTVLGDSLFSNFNYNKVDKSKVVLLGIKDVDDAEWDYIHKNKITYYTMDDIVERGVGPIWLEIQQKLSGLPIHLSMDIDGLDFDIAPGTGMINNGGINYREIKYLTKKISQQNLVSVDLAEVNPLFDVNKKTQTLAVELLADLFGGRWSEYERYLFVQNSKVQSA